MSDEEFYTTPFVGRLDCKSMTTFQVERLDDCWKEIELLLEAHWHEVALDHSVIPLDPDWDSYRKLDEDGSLFIVTCRHDGKVVGYFAAIVKPHLHYRSTLHAFVDVYYLSPEHRRGICGVKLIKEAEKELAKRGVRKVFSGTKKHLDMSPIFERLGWRTTETLYTKVLP